MTSIIAVDLGKTSCRVRIVDPQGHKWAGSGPGAPGLAERGGVQAALDAISAALIDTASTTSPPPAVLSIGAAGSSSAPSAQRELAIEAQRRWSCPVAVTSDLITAHAGALDGRPGTVLVVGTGAVACHLSPAGDLRRVDGWGPWLGDDGSGRWIGTEAVRAALHDHDGRGRPTSLTSAVADRLVPDSGDLSLTPARVGASPHPPRLLASLAPLVLDHATVGDPVALDIINRSAQLLAATARAAGRSGAVAALGGLLNDPTFHDSLSTAMDHQGMRLVPAAADALIGALLIATHDNLPQERHVHRLC